jgi:hypothetical protein
MVTPTTMRERITQAAEVTHPQFRWRSPEWRLARLVEPVVTKGGTAFRCGEFTLAQPYAPHPGGFRAYSRRRRGLVIISGGTFVWADESVSAVVTQRDET